MLSDGTCRAQHDLEVLQFSDKKAERDRYYDLEARFEALAHHGALEQPRKFRSLRTPEGLWEIKTSTDRVGCYKADHLEVSDNTIRLTHRWEKDTNKTDQGKTPHKQKNFGDKIIREDRHYGTRTSIQNQ